MYNLRKRGPIGGASDPSGPEPTGKKAKRTRQEPATATCDSSDEARDTPEQREADSQPTAAPRQDPDRRTLTTSQPGRSRRISVTQEQVQHEDEKDGPKSCQLQGHVAHGNQSQRGKNHQGPEQQTVETTEQDPAAAEEQQGAPDDGQEQEAAGQRQDTAAQADSGAEEDQLKGVQSHPKSRYELQQPFKWVGVSDTRGTTVAYKARLGVPSHLRTSATDPERVVVGSR